jgi:transcriptional regulator with XRE-family HTH domain
MTKKPAPSTASTGLRQLDLLLGGGLRCGDNVVWCERDKLSSYLFARHLLERTLEEGKRWVSLVFEHSPAALLELQPQLEASDRVTIIDAFTWGQGGGAEVFTRFYRTRAPHLRCNFVRVEEPHDMVKVLNAVFAECSNQPQDVRLAVSSLSGATRLWGGDEGLADFYATCCPRLLEMGAIAYWLLDPATHSARMIAKISRIAQIVMFVSLKRGAHAIEIRKAAQADPSTIGVPQSFYVQDGSIIMGTVNNTLPGIDIGRHVRELRLGRGLSQSEVAKLTGVTPSTISQVESNLISPSLPALHKMAEVLGVTLAEFFEGAASASRPVVRVAADAEVATPAHLPADKVVVHSLTRRPGKSHSVKIVELAVGVGLDDHFFRVKVREIYYVLAGTIAVSVNGVAHRLQEGDLVELTHDIPSRWENVGDAPARLLAVLFG